MDWLGAAVWIGAVAIAITLGAAGLLVYNNLASKTVVLAGSAFAGAAVIFVINLWTDLHGSTTRDRISVEYVMDRAKPEIRSWAYPTIGVGRLTVEVGASDWLVANRPKEFVGDRERLALDLALFSLVGHLTRKEFDWQMRSVVYEGDVSGTSIQFQRLSKAGECREYSRDELKNALVKVGNVFGEVPLFVVGGAVCLPPGGILEISSSSITLRTPICQLKFEVESSGGLSNMIPRSGGKVELLPDKSSRYETRVVGVDMEIRRFALRANHREAVKYAAWCQRVMDSTREWFSRPEPEPPEPRQQWTQPGPVAPLP
jgi:hypothetical protein